MNRQDLLLWTKKYGTWAALILICLMFASTTDGVFFSARNLSNLARQIVIVGSISLGMTMVILMGGIDLSVGSLVGMGGILVAVLTTRLGWKPAPAILVTLVVGGTLPGFLNGYISEKFRFHPFVTTLGIMTVARGVTMLISPVSLGVDEGIRFLGQYDLSKTATVAVLVVAFLGYAAARIFASLNQAKYEKHPLRAFELGAALAAAAIVCSALGIVFLAYRGLPLMVLIFAVFVICVWFILKQTRTGRYMYAIGGNYQAARLSGINIMYTWVFGFVVTGMLACFSGILLAGRLGGATPTSGAGYELSVIAAVVIGGTSLMGGVGTVSGTLVGIFILGVLSNGMSLWGLSSYVQMVVQGVVIVLAVILDAVTKKIRG